MSSGLGASRRLGASLDAVGIEALTDYSGAVPRRITPALCLKIRGRRDKPGDLAHEIDFNQIDVTRLVQIDREPLLKAGHHHF